jgi:hypothetical protein
MFKIEEAMFSVGTLLPLALLVFSLVVGIVVSKLSEWAGNGKWESSR